jgi:hypothetical protein
LSTLKPPSKLAKDEQPASLQTRLEPHRLQWTGFDRAADEPQKEIARLWDLVSRAAYELKDVRADGKSRRLLRALDGR